MGIRLDSVASARTQSQSQPQPLPGHGSSGGGSGSTAGAGATPWDGAASEWMQRAVALPKPHSARDHAIGLGAGALVGIGIGIGIGVGAHRVGMSASRFGVATLALGGVGAAGGLLGGWVAASHITSWMADNRIAQLSGSQPQKRLPAPDNAAVDRPSYGPPADRLHLADIRVTGGNGNVASYVSRGSALSLHDNYDDAVATAERDMARASGASGGHGIAYAVVQSEYGPRYSADRFSVVEVGSVIGDTEAPAGDPMKTQQLTVVNKGLAALVTDSETYVAAP